ncbi:MAG: hypothetical protein ACYDIA_11525, partial [Candidatus Humimicrobiaceae bacterium]
WILGIKCKFQTLNLHDAADFFIEGDEHTKGCNKSWARLIKKIYEVGSSYLPQVWWGYENYCIYRGL